MKKLILLFTITLLNASIVAEGLTTQVTKAMTPIISKSRSELIKSEVKVSTKLIDLAQQTLNSIDIENLVINRNLETEQEITTLYWEKNNPAHKINHKLVIDNLVNEFIFNLTEDFEFYSYTIKKLVDILDHYQEISKSFKIIAKNLIAQRASFNSKHKFTGQSHSEIVKMQITACKQIFSDLNKLCKSLGARLDQIVDELLTKNPGLLMPDTTTKHIKMNKEICADIDRLKASNLIANAINENNTIQLEDVVKTLTIAMPEYIKSGSSLYEISM